MQGRTRRNWNSSYKNAFPPWQRRIWTVLFRPRTKLLPGNDILRKKNVKKMHLIDVYQALIDETILNDNDNNMNHYIFIRVDTHISGFFQYPVFGRIVFSTQSRSLFKVKSYFWACQTRPQAVRWVRFIKRTGYQTDFPYAVSLMLEY